MGASVMTVLLVAAMLVVLNRMICVVGSLDSHRFDGHPLQFAALALHWSLLAVGAVAVSIGMTKVGGPALLVAVALRLLTDRRRA